MFQLQNHREHCCAKIHSLLDDDILAKVAAIEADKQARDMTGDSVQMLASLHQASPHEQSYPDFVLNKSKGRTEEYCTQVHR